MSWEQTFSSHLAQDYSTFSLLRDGRSIRIRAVRAADRTQLEAAFQRLSGALEFNRFFGQRERITPADVQAVINPDFISHVVLVATLRGHESERIIGIGHYRVHELSPADERSAAVSFMVADEFQGFGISTLLLENLSALAQSAGVAHLECVVPQNNERMRAVFEQSGVLLTVENHGDTLLFRTTTEHTAHFLSASTTRFMSAAAESIKRLLNPRSVALVGASRQKTSIGGAILSNLRGGGYRGKLFLVNPAASEIDGLPCWPSVSALPEPVELAVIVVPAKAVLTAVEECAALGVGGVVIISAGFAEVSAEGRALEQRLKEIVRSSGMRMVGPNCFGVINTNERVSLNSTFAPLFPPRGRVGMLSQSGALGLAILDYLQSLNIGISTFVSVGNKTDVSGNDLLSFWASDPDTDVIALYLESFGNPRMFARLAPQVARRKPIVAVKSGRSAAGSRAASSHSAALANLDVAVDALFAEAGVIRTNTLEELFDVIALLSTQPIPKGPGVCIVTNAGGPGILLADALEAKGLKLPTLAEETLNELRSFLPAAAGFSNPIDMIASAGPNEYRRTLEIVGRDPAVHSVIAIYIPPLVSDAEAVAQAIADGAGLVPREKPVLAVYISSKGAPPVLSNGPRGHLPAFSFPENAAQALAHAEWYGRWRNKPAGAEIILDSASHLAIRRIIDGALERSAEKQWLPMREVEEVFAALKIPFARSIETAPEDAPLRAAELGYPIVAKGVSPNLVHKSDIGGVILGLNSAADVRHAVRTLAERLARINAPLSSVLLQQQIDDGLEAIVGVTTDPVFGPIILCGLGGTQVEILKDVSFHLPPVTDVNAREMLDRLRSARLLEGYRGSPPTDREALASIITRISALIEIAPEIRELDLNPIKVLAPGRGATVVDARIRIGPPGGGTY